MDTPILRTNRLFLRGLKAEDREAILAMHDDPEFHRYLGSERRTDQDIWLRALSGAGMWPTYGHGFWVVEANDRLIGHIGIAEFFRGFDPPLPAPECAWVLARPAWRQGYGREAVAAMLAWADRTGLAQTCCIISPENLGSVGIAERVGFKAMRRIEKDGDEVIMFVRDRP